MIFQKRIFLCIVMSIYIFFSQNTTALAESGEQVTAGYKGGFFLKTENGQFKLKLGGRVTSHVWLYQRNSITHSDLFLTRARVWFNATVWKHFLIRIQNEFLTDPSLRDAYLDVNYTPSLRFMIGQFKVPFSPEIIYSHKYIDLVERPVVVQRSLDPTRDVGAMIHGTAVQSILKYQIALISGAGQNLQDNNKDKDIVGRLMVSPFKLMKSNYFRDFSFGAAATYGKQPALGGNSIYGQTVTGYRFYEPVAVKGDRLRLNAQLAWFAGPFSVKGEYIRTIEERKDIVVSGQTNLGDFETEGWYLTASWIITGEKEQPDRPAPTSPFLVQGGELNGTGLLKMASRYEVFMLDSERRHGLAEPMPITFRAWTFGLTWYPVELIRISLDYQMQHFSDVARSPRPRHEVASLVMARAQAEF